MMAPPLGLIILSSNRIEQDDDLSDGRGSGSVTSRRGLEDGLR